MGRRRRHPAYGVWLGLGSVVLGSVLLAACGATPVAQPPSGIDGLTIPTPSPDPADFVDHVDNPWFPLAPGTRWTYRLDTPDTTSTITATVRAQPRRIEGVDTTPVVWQERGRGGRVRTLAVRWYAQDTAGNVWWFGQRLSPGGPRVDLLATSSWMAGRRGAEAGLQLAAEPRQGDGYDNGYLPRVAETHSTVVAVDATVALPKGDYHHTVATRSLSPLAPTRQVESFYASGTGLVAQQATQTLATDLTLTRVRRP